MRYWIIFLYFSSASLITAQSDSISKWVFSGYTEFYWAHQFDNLVIDQRPSYLYNHRRLNELTLNLGYAKAAYNSGHMRGNFALMTGTYAQYNLQSEPTWASFIYEANLGIKLSSKNLWLDVGIMPSHIGFESAIGFDCQTLTRSILAENSPYYESGARLSYQDIRQKFYISALLLNGWQKIERALDDKISYGLQMMYKPSPNFTINYSNFFGIRSDDVFYNKRLFHNLYLQYNSQQAFDFTLGADFGKDFDKGNNSKKWHGLIFITGIKMHPRHYMAMRYEKYIDIENAIISSPEFEDFNTGAFSVNYDYLVNPNTKMRIEYRNISSARYHYQTPDNTISKLNGLTLALCAKL